MYIFCTLLPLEGYTLRTHVNPLSVYYPHCIGVRCLGCHPKGPRFKSWCRWNFAFFFPFSTDVVSDHGQNGRHDEGPWWTHTSAGCEFRSAVWQDFRAWCHMHRNMYGAAACPSLCRYDRAAGHTPTVTVTARIARAGAPSAPRHIAMGWNPFGCDQRADLGRFGCFWAILGPFGPTSAPVGWFQTVQSSKTGANGRQRGVGGPNFACRTSPANG